VLQKKLCMLLHLVVLFILEINGSISVMHGALPVSSGLTSWKPMHCIDFVILTAKLIIQKLFNWRTATRSS
jgi:hypothetical protein